MRRKRTAESKLYFNILKEIFRGANYNRLLASKLNMQPNALIEHLKYLEKKGLLKATREKELNKKLYSINYEKLALLFAEDLEYCLLAELKTKTAGYYSKETIKIRTEQVKTVSKALKESKSIAPILQAIFIFLFAFNRTTPIYKTNAREEIQPFQDVAKLRDVFAVTLAFLKYLILNEEAKEERETWEREFESLNELFKAIEILKVYFFGEGNSQKNHAYAEVFIQVFAFARETKKGIKESSTKTVSSPQSHTNI